MNTAVTGGSGIVGRAVVAHLLREGHRVRALARSPGASVALQELGATPVDGDVLDPPSLAPLVAGADWVFHIAGVNQMCARDPSRMDRVNIDGTRNVLTACLEGGSGRLIHTSSAAAIGEEKGTVATESTAHRGRYLSRYERSKHLSEMLVFAERDGLEVVSVNPSSVQGPGRATGTGRLFLDAVNGRLPFLIDTVLSIVDIDDCARGHILAARHGLAGERYLLSGVSLDARSALALLGQVTGRTLEARFVPGRLVLAGAAVVELGARITGRDPAVCREMVRVLMAGHRYDGTRAVRELGLEYTPFESTLRRTVEWFHTQGLLT